MWRDARNPEIGARDLRRTPAALHARLRWSVHRAELQGLADQVAAQQRACTDIAGSIARLCAAECSGVAGPHAAAAVEPQFAPRSHARSSSFSQRAAAAPLVSGVPHHHHHHHHDPAAAAFRGEAAVGAAESASRSAGKDHGRSAVDDAEQPLPGAEAGDAVEAASSGAHGRSFAATPPPPLVVVEDVADPPRTSGVDAPDGASASPLPAAAEAALSSLQAAIGAVGNSGLEARGALPSMQLPVPLLEKVTIPTRAPRSIFEDEERIALEQQERILAEQAAGGVPADGIPILRRRPRGAEDSDADADRTPQGVAASRNALSSVVAAVSPMRDRIASAATGICSSAPHGASSMVAAAAAGDSADTGEGARSGVLEEASRKAGEMTALVSQQLLPFAPLCESEHGTPASSCSEAPAPERRPFDALAATVGPSAYPTEARNSPTPPPQPLSPAGTHERLVEAATPRERGGGVSGRGRHSRTSSMASVADAISAVAATAIRALTPPPPSPAAAYADADAREQEQGKGQQRVPEPGRRTCTDGGAQEVAEAGDGDGEQMKKKVEDEEEDEEEAVELPMPPMSLSAARQDGQLHSVVLRERREPSFFRAWKKRHVCIVGHRLLLYREGAQPSDSWVEGVSLLAVRGQLPAEPIHRCENVIVLGPVSTNPAAGCGDASGAVAKPIVLGCDSPEERGRLVRAIKAGQRVGNVMVAKVRAQRRAERLSSAAAATVAAAAAALAPSLPPSPPPQTDPPPNTQPQASPLAPPAPSKAAPPPSSPGGTSARRATVMRAARAAQFRSRLTALLSFYKPARLSEVSEILEKAGGKETQMLEELLREFGGPPPSYATRVTRMCKKHCPSELSATLEKLKATPPDGGEYDAVLRPLVERFGPER